MLPLIATHKIKLKLTFALTLIFMTGLLALNPVAAGQNHRPIQLSQNTANSPSSVIDRFHAALLNAMKNAKQLGIQGRYQKLAPEVAQAYDLDRWIRLSSGRFWRKASDTQKLKLKSAFKEMSAATYASQFKSYSGERFKTLGEKPGPQKSVLVETQIIRNDKKPVGLTYIVFKVGDQWRIVDILLDNKISQLAVRRSEYRSLLKQSGINGLIDKLKEITSRLLAG